MFCTQSHLQDTVRAREVLIKRHMLYVTAFFLSWVMEICYRFRTVVTRSAVSHEIESAHLAMLHLQPVILLCARALDPTVQILLQDAPNSAVLTSSAVMRHKDTGPASRPLLLAVFSQSGLMADEDDVITEDGDPDGNVGNEHVASLYAPPTLPGSVSAPIPILTTISPSSLPVWNGSPRQRVEKSSVPSSSVVEFASISKGSINSNVPLLTFTPPLTPSNASATSPRLVPLSPSAAQVAAALDGHGPRSLSVYTHRPVTPSVPVPTPKPTASIRTTQPRRSIQLNPERKLQEELGMCLLSGLLQSVQRDDHAFCTGEPMVHDAHLRREHSRRAATFDESAAPVIRSTSSTPAVHSADGAIPRTVSTPSGSESEPAIMLEFDKASRLETLYLQLVSGEGDAAETTTQCFEFYTLFPVGFSSIRRQCRKDSVLHSQQLLYDAALRELAPVGTLR